MAEGDTIAHNAQLLLERCVYLDNKGGVVTHFSKCFPDFMALEFLVKMHNISSLNAT